MIPIERPSPNFDARITPIDMLVLHYTGMPDGADALARLIDPEAKVSAHYLVEEDGRVFQLVAEDRRAWHAGVAAWRGQGDINSRSIGIELVNPGHEWGYRGFPQAQFAALIELAAGVMARHTIPARHVLGHSDVAPRRKQDPGEYFDWRGLAAAGIGLWSDAGGDDAPLAAEDLAGFHAALAEFGYDLGDLEAATTAFHRHFLRHHLGRAATSASLARIRALLALV